MQTTQTQQLFLLAQQQHQAGNLSDAEKFYRQILATEPDNPDALHFLGVIAHQQNQNELAVDLIRRSLAIRPDNSLAHANLGNALNGLGKLNEAIAAYAVAAPLMPGNFVFHYNYGVALQTGGRLDEAIESFRKATAINPYYIAAHCNLSHCLKNIGRVEEALASARTAVDFDPADPHGHGNLGNALLSLGQVDEAIEAFRKAILLDSQAADAHVNLGLALLLRGDFTEGWGEYEWRWKADQNASMRRNFRQPQWDGSPLNDRVLLIHAEQGLGDVIQFSRYLSMIESGKIVFEVQPELHRLFQPLARYCQVVRRGDPLPAFDLHGPLLALPRIFQTTLNSIPPQVPDLLPDADLLQHWQQRLALDHSKLNVALAWAGNPTHANNKNRSVALDQLATLVDVAGTSFYGLQKGDAGRETKAVKIISLGSELHDLANTAAVISAMDLVITVDTSVAHLAGALGKPVWVLLPFAPDWRWLIEREDSPWYPSMRLFRQTVRGDWKGVIERVVQALREIL